MGKLFLKNLLQTVFPPRTLLIFQRNLQWNFFFKVAGRQKQQGIQAFEIKEKSLPVICCNEIIRTPVTSCKTNPVKLSLNILLLLLFPVLKAQDTIIVNNNFKFKVGVKVSNEGTSDIMYDDNHHWVVYGGGLQLIGKMNKTRSCFETGVYYTTKAKDYDSYNYDRRAVFTQYICVPVNYRYESKVIYISGGIFFDYLVNRFSRYPISSIPGYGVDRKFMVGFDVEIGVEKQISRTMNFYVEGKLFDTVSSPKKGGGGLIVNNFRTTYRNYGFSIGVNYKFLR